MLRWRPVATTILAAAIALALGGCGGGATPTPAPTPTAAPTPAPTPTPVAVADELVARLLAARTGVLGLTGMMLLAGTEIPLSGTLALANDATQSSIALDLPNGRQTNETIRVGTTQWERANGGPWVTNPEPADTSKSLAAFLETLTTLEDKGVETRDGRQLHRLVPPASATLSAEALGFNPENATDATVAMEFWAEDDGTPAIWAFNLGWNQVSGTSTVPVKLAMDLDLAGLGKTATVAAPEDPWERYTSTKLGYSMAHPPGWTVTAGDGQDSYLVDGTPYVTVAPQALPGYTLDQFSKELIASYQKQLKVKPDGSTDMTLGGQPARFLTYHFTRDDGVKVYVADAVTMAGDTGWEVFLTEQAGSEADDTPVFEAMLSTFELAK
jgi:hypothetical protein